MFKVTDWSQWYWNRKRLGSLNQWNKISLKTIDLKWYQEINYLLKMKVYIVT